MAVAVAVATRAGGALTRRDLVDWLTDLHWHWCTTPPTLPTDTAFAVLLAASSLSLLHPPAQHLDHTHPSPSPSSLPPRTHPPLPKHRRHSWHDLSRHDLPRARSHFLTFPFLPFSGTSTTAAGTSGRQTCARPPARSCYVLIPVTAGNKGTVRHGACCLISQARYGSFDGVVRACTASERAPADNKLEWNRRTSSAQRPAPVHQATPPAASAQLPPRQPATPL